jgi:hypothetical protein
VGRTSKRAIIGIALSGVLAALMGCTSWPIQSTPLQTELTPKVVKPAPKSVATRRVVKPVQASTQKRPVIPAAGGGGTGTGGTTGSGGAAGSGGGSTGGGWGG